MAVPAPQKNIRFCRSHRGESITHRDSTREAVIPFVLKLLIVDDVLLRKGKGRARQSGAKVYARVVTWLSTSREELPAPAALAILLAPADPGANVPTVTSVAQSWTL